MADSQTDHNMKHNLNRIFKWESECYVKKNKNKDHTTAHSLLFSRLD